MSISLADFASPHIGFLPVRPWPDPVIDALGHDPRSAYVERFWLSTLGPSTTWLLRLMAAGLEASPGGFDLDLTEASLALGLGGRGGRHSPFVRALGRLCRFDIAEARLDGSLAVRRKVPPLTRRQVLQLPASMQEAHRAWQEADLSAPAGEQLQRRARRLALSLFELGEDRESAERQLLRWKFSPALARESSAWGWDRHQRALTDSPDAGGYAVEVGGGPAGAA